jgi:hypothetical protein
MINVWLDDVRDPARFRPGEEWHWCKTNTEFVRVLDTMADQIGKIALDHDKCHLIEEPDKMIVDTRACDETYEPSVRYMALWAVFFNKTNVPVEIITSNPDGAKRYKDILSERFIVTVNPGGAQKK